MIEIDERREGKLPCPVCGVAMRVERKEKVEIDVCAEHGIWLNKDEMEEITRSVRQRSRELGQSLQRVAVKKSKQDGKLMGSLFGFWSLLSD